MPAWLTLKQFIQAHFLDVALIIALIGASVFLVIKLRERFIHMIESKHGKRPLKAFMIHLFSLLLILTLVIVILSNFGVETASLITLLGSAGIGIALSFKDALSHVAAGIMMVIDSPFKANDVIQLGDIIGTVDVVSLHSTLIRTNTNQLISIPNGKLINEKIINLTAGKYIGDNLSINLSQNEKFDDSYQQLLTLIQSAPGVRAEPAPKVLMTQLGSNVITVNVSYWTKATEAEQVKSDMLNCLRLASLSGQLDLA